MKIHNIFYLNLLQKIVTDFLLDQVNETLLPVIINNEEEWEIKEIFDAKTCREKVQYKVK